MTSLIVACTLTFLVTLAGTGMVRNYALRRLIDVPNARSSHTQPTPRGGGIAIALAHLGAVIVGWFVGDVSGALAFAVLGGGLAVVVVGFVDDHHPLPPGLRLAVHCLAAAWLLSCLGHLPPVDFGAHAVDLGIVGSLLAVMYVVWFVNLFNFMDGIDGIAGMQALTMATGAALLARVGGANAGELVPFLTLACAAAAFLVWNRPPAKIFMGDAGSGFLGFALSALAFWSVTEGWVSVWTWPILGGTFLADATTTLFTRAVNGNNVIEAHRSHAYQRLARHWDSHGKVTLAYAAANLLWLWPWAIIAAERPDLGVLSTAASLAPLFLLAAWLGAGRGGDITASRD